MRIFSSDLFSKTKYKLGTARQVHLVF